MTFIEEILSTIKWLNTSRAEFLKFGEIQTYTEDDGQYRVDPENGQEYVEEEYQKILADIDTDIEIWEYMANILQRIEAFETLTDEQIDIMLNCVDEFGSSINRPMDPLKILIPIQLWAEENLEQYLLFLGTTVAPLNDIVSTLIKKINSENTSNGSNRKIVEILNRILNDEAIAQRDIDTLAKSQYTLSVWDELQSLLSKIFVVLRAPKKHQYVNITKFDEFRTPTALSDPQNLQLTKIYGQLEKHLLDFDRNGEKELLKINIIFSLASMFCEIRKFLKRINANNPTYRNLISTMDRIEKGQKANIQYITKNPLLLSFEDRNTLNYLSALYTPLKKFRKANPRLGLFARPTIKDPEPPQAIKQLFTH